MKIEIIHIPTQFVDSTPLDWYRAKLRNIPEHIHNPLLAMIERTLANHDSVINLLLALSKRIYPNRLLNVRTSIDTELEKTEGFEAVSAALQLISINEPLKSADQSTDALYETIDALWERSGSTLRSGFVMYETLSDSFTIDLVSAAHAIIEDGRLIACTNPMNLLSNLVAQLNGQQQIITEPVRKWFELIKDLPAEVQNDATCKLCALIAKALTLPSHQ